MHKGGPGEHKVLKNAERWKNVLLKSRLKTGNRPGTHFQKNNSSERGRGIPRFESNWNVCSRKEELGARAILYYSERMVLNHMELRTKLQKQPLYIGGKRPAGALSSWTSIKWPPGLKEKRGREVFTSFRIVFLLKVLFSLLPLSKVPFPARASRFFFRTALWPFYLFDIGLLLLLTWPTITSGLDGPSFPLSR